eukprot:6284151-Heterocapsa_arctica.AAC.1
MDDRRRNSCQNKYWEAHKERQQRTEEHFMDNKVSNLTTVRRNEHYGHYNFDTRMDQHGAQKEKYKRRLREQNGSGTYEDYGGKWEYYLHYNRRRLAQKGTELFGGKPTNGDGPLERWEGARRTGRISPLQTTGTAMA